MAEHEEHEPRIPERELSEFANSLFGYLYFEIDMHHYRVNSSRFFREEMVTAVLCLRNATRDFNSRILNECGYGVDKLTLCQEVCNLYPPDMYFKKLYYITGFILEMMHWWYESEDVDISLGPNIWQTIFRVNFESKFQSEGGWDGLQRAAEECYVRLLDGILPREDLLPAMVTGVVARVRQLNSRPQPALPDEAEAALESFRVKQMEIEDDSSDESMPSEEGIEKNQPGKVAQVEESKEERQPGVMDDRPGPSGIGGNVAQVEESKEESQPGVMDDRPGPSRIGGNVAQTEHLGESSAGKSGENVLPSLGDKNTRKRKHDSPSKTDSKEELDSPSKAKMDKKDSKV